MSEKWECPYCHKTLDLKNKYTKSGHQARCTEWWVWRDQNLTMTFFDEHYIRLGKSLPEIAEELGLVSVAPLYNQMKRLGVSARTISTSKKMPRAKERGRKSYLENWGVEHNLCANSQSRLDWELRLFQEEGICNVFQRQDVIEKGKATKEQRYGERNLWHCKWYRDKIAQSMVFSTIHRKVFEYLVGEEIPAEIEFAIQKDGDQCNFYDIHVKGTQLLIETNGDYWHANPNKYKASDVFHFPQKTMTAQERWDYDRQRIELAEKEGFSVLILWETDIKKHWDACIARIENFLKGTCNDHSEN